MAADVGVVGYFGAENEAGKITSMQNYFYFLILFLFSHGLLSPAPVFGWGREGHRIVADIAQSRLSPTAKLQLTKLLGNDDLAGVSFWADEIKGERPETYGWHFVDIPMSSSGFSEPRDCYRPDAKHLYAQPDHYNCVVDRIEIFEQVLADRMRTEQERIEALKFLVHLVGDVHQPLHAIGEARGGNDIHVVQFGSSQCGRYACNLHFAWDVGLIEHSGLSEEQYVARLEKRIMRENLSLRSGGTAVAWADESFLQAKKIWLNDGASVDEAYYKKNIGILDECLALAGIRLAYLLNQGLGKGSGADGTQTANK